MTVQTLNLRPVTPTVGAEVEGIDLRSPLDDRTVDFLHQALLDHLVLFFRHQDLDDEQHLAFARHFGQVLIPPFQNAASTRPDVMVLDQTDARGQGADCFHTDSTYMAEPPMGSILRAVQLPDDGGGDTCFASMYAAYDALSDRMQAYLEGLTAIHDITSQLLISTSDGTTRLDVSATQAKFPPVEHPVIRTHPETGRKAIFVVPYSTTRIVGLPATESAMLIAYLLEHVRQPELQCRFRWEVGSVAFWDNRSAQHHAVADYRDRRIMRRVTLAGDRPA